MSQAFSLFTVDGAGATHPANGEEVLEAARRVLAHRVRRGATLTSPKLTRDFLTLQLGSREYETFCVLYLDNRHRVLDFVKLFRGTIDGASVHPREVVKEALLRNAAAVIVAGNITVSFAERGLL
jgi:DNA repair protein RadC